LKNTVYYQIKNLSGNGLENAGVIRFFKRGAQIPKDKLNKFPELGNGIFSSCRIPCYTEPIYTTFSAPFPNFATTVTGLVPDVPAKVPLAPGLASRIPFCVPLTETLSSVISPVMQVLAITWRWIDEGGTFWPLIAMVQDGGCEAVGATKSVEEMIAAAGIFLLVAVGDYRGTGRQ